MKKSLWIAAALCGLALAACSLASPIPSPSQLAASDPLAGTSWILTQLNGQPALADVSITLEFSDGRLGGSDGCNLYGGAYKVEGSQLKVDANMAGTLMACADEIMQQASAYTAALQQSPAFQVEGEQLSLLDEKGKVLAVLTKQSQDLAGTEWIVTAINADSQGVVSTLTEPQITAAFGSDGQVSGSAGCNRYFAGFSVDGTALKIDPPSATKMFCGEPAGLMEQESRFLKALESAVRYRISGSTLELYRADGSIAVTLASAS